MNSLVLYEAARTALAEARRIDEVMTIRDEMERMKLYAEQARDRGMLADAAEIHMRATRKLGIMLVAAKEAGQIQEGRPRKSSGNCQGDVQFPRVTLDEVGITRNLSSQAQRAGSISERAYEAMIARTREKIASGGAAVIDPGKDITTAAKQQRRANRERVLGECQVSLPDKKYGVIVCDDEWDHAVWSRESGMDRHAANHYETASDAHTASEMHERTKDRFECAARDCFLGMWSTVQHLAIAVDLLRMRGFRYVSHYVWGKDKIGLGFWNRNKHEIMLCGVKGDIPCPAPGTQWTSLIIAPRGKHSAKPEIFLEMIEQYFPTLPKIEFNRRGPARPGWDAWGNEAEPAHDADGLIENEIKVAAE